MLAASHRERHSRSCMMIVMTQTGRERHVPPGLRHLCVRVDCPGTSNISLLNLCFFNACFRLTVCLAFELLPVMAAREASSSSAGSIVGERAEPVTVSGLRINNLQDALEALWVAYCGLLKSPSSGPPFAKEGYQEIRRGSVVVWADSNDSSLHDVSTLDCGQGWSLSDRS